MPIYEYQCHKCGVFEVTQRITESPLKKCPTCKGKVERILSRSSFVLKGSGWYATDYGKKPSSTSTDSTPANGSSGNGDSSKTESTAKSETSSKSDTSTKTSSDKTTTSKSAD